MNSALERPSYWERQRRTYNLILLLAFVVSGFFYHLFSMVFGDAFPDYELTVFTLLAQTLATFIAMALANVFYFLGPLVEMMIPEKGRPKYQQWAFLGGVGFSVLIPSMVPLFTLFIGLSKTVG